MILSSLTDDAEPFVKRGRQSSVAEGLFEELNLATLAVTLIKEYKCK
jgi:hypothetical protein